MVNDCHREVARPCCVSCRCNLSSNQRQNLKGEKNHNEFLIQESITLFWYRNRSGYRKVLGKVRRMSLPVFRWKGKICYWRSAPCHIHLLQQLGLVPHSNYEAQFSWVTSTPKEGLHLCINRSSSHLKRTVALLVPVPLWPNSQSSTGTMLGKERKTGREKSRKSWDNKAKNWIEIWIVAHHKWDRVCNLSFIKLNTY